jgi:signal transduction histidine kinase
MNLSPKVKEFDSVMETQDHILTERIHHQKMESIGLMAGGVAHDIKNFIHIIAVNTNFIKDVTGDTRIAERCRRILDVCYKASDLVTDMLTLAKNNQVRAKPVDLNEEVAKTLSLLAGTQPEEIRLEVAFSGDLPAILGNPTQICRIVTNLINNAKDAIYGEGCITITTQKVTVSEMDCQAHGNARPGEFVTLTIRETGPGIPPEFISNIFDPFFSTKNGKNNVGIGLAVVYALVRNHQGWIDVESNQAKGTRFTVFFPMKNR